MVICRKTFAVTCLYTHIADQQSQDYKVALSVIYGKTISVEWTIVKSTIVSKDNLCMVYAECCIREYQFTVFPQLINTSEVLLFSCLKSKHFVPK